MDVAKYSKLNNLNYKRKLAKTKVPNALQQFEMEMLSINFCWYMTGRDPAILVRWHKSSVESSSDKS